MTADHYRVQIRVENGHLDGTMLVPQTTVPGVLFVHGWGCLLYTSDAADEHRDV